MAGIILPWTAKSKGGALFDAGACLKAVEVLGLECDVVVKWSQGYRRVGCHRYRDGQHHITVSTYSQPEAASKTLWHELAHALQVERLGKDEYYRKYKMYGKSGRAYQANPFEVEAREFEEDFHAALPLTKEV